MIETIEEQLGHAQSRQWIAQLLPEHRRALKNSLARVSEWRDDVWQDVRNVLAFGQSLFTQPLSGPPDLDGDPVKEKRREDAARHIALGIDHAASFLTKPEVLMELRDRL